MVQSEITPKYYFKDIFVYQVYGSLSEEDIANNIGSTWEDISNGKYVELSKEQVEFYKENPTATIEEIFYMKLNNSVTTRDKLNAINYLLSYDSSPEVNTFYINGDPLWINKDNRRYLRDALRASSKNGEKSFTLFANDKTYEIDIVILEEILDSVEFYAMNCLLITNKLKQRIQDAKTREEIKSILDMKKYPDKLKFEI